MRRERLGISGCDLLRLIVENQFSCPKKLDSMIFAPLINHFSAPKTFFQQQKGRRDVGFAGFWWFLAVQFHGCSFEQFLWPFAGHADGRSSALGGFLSVAGPLGTKFEGFKGPNYCERVSIYGRGCWHYYAKNSNYLHVTCPANRLCQKERSHPTHQFWRAILVSGEAMKRT